ncbi:hypothetical protein MAR_032935 [Mya arenaria]|uniref:Uncharacterized protein n=1 Tax=Mya arenaria TaxID=6604 RepID=A0ABY7G7J1_MYAAR|nr:hypothetical protein MAR_032935 [Mya arenaria]
MEYQYQEISINKGSVHMKPQYDYVVPLSECKSPSVIVGVGSAVSCVKSHMHDDLAAIMVFIQYLTQLEGPLWRQIRGLGLSYHYRSEIWDSHTTTGAQLTEPGVHSILQPALRSTLNAYQRFGVIISPRKFTNLEDSLERQIGRTVIKLRADRQLQKCVFTCTPSQTLVCCTSFWPDPLTLSMLTKKAETSCK